MKHYISLFIAILLLIGAIISCEEEKSIDNYANKKIELKHDVLNELKKYVALPFDKVFSELQNKGLKLNFYPKDKLNNYDTYTFSNSEGTNSYIICVEDSAIVNACFCLSDIKKVDSILSRFSYWEKRLQDFEFKNNFYAKILSYNDSFNNKYRNRSSFLLDFNKNKTSLGKAYEEIEGNKISGYVYFSYDKNKAMSYVGFNTKDENDLINNHNEEYQPSFINYLTIE